MIAIKRRPALTPMEAGHEFKAFTVVGKSRMEMPPRTSTKDAMVLVQEGNAILSINGENQELIAGETSIIPAGSVHSLYLLSNFKAVVIMGTDSEIEFK